MDCKQIREYWFDLESGQAPAAAQEHVSHCTACAAELAELRRTMSLLDSWTVPEPSPYFDTRLRARLHEATRTPVGWWAKLRRPAMALVFMLIIAVGVSIQSRRPIGTPPVMPVNVADVNARPGTAVGDLQALDKDHDLIANIELLDQVSREGAGETNP